jgi:hypothetical protein
VPALLTCRYCHRAGFVRSEHVITKSHASQQFYCGACDRHWEIHEKEAQAPRQPKIAAEKTNRTDRAKH